MSPLFAAVRRAALLCLPVAAILVVGVTPPCASAQTPTSPNGQDTPPTGWVPQPRPGVTNPQSYGDYDWTGISGTVIRDPFVGQYPLDPYQSWVGSRGYSLGGSYFLEYPFNSTGGNGNTLAEVNTQFSGTTTYKWKWVPPNNAAGQPDTANFPAPALFTLYNLYATLGTQLSNSPYSAGLTVTGKVADGAPDGWTSSVSTAGQSITDVFPRRMLMPASAPDANGVSSVALSLSGNLDVTGKQAMVVNGYNGIGAPCISAISESGQAYPLILSAPNPLTNPLRGDGGNQFVHDTHQPDGILVLPASVNVAGTGTADTTFLLPHVTLPVTPVVPHMLSSSLTASGSSIVVSTVGHYPDPDTATSYPAASYIAKGLPAANSDFGNHVVTLTVDGTASELANCQTFYTGSTSNWPGSIGTEQNWYAYYGLSYPLAAFKVGYDPNRSRPQFLAFTNFYPNDQGQYTIYLEDATGGGDLEVPLFDINPVADANLHRNLVRQVGTLRIKGIHRYIWIAAHEWGHQKIFQRNPQDIYTTAVQDGAGNYQWLPITDGDHVLDAWESTHHLNPNVSDTTGAYAYTNNGSSVKFEPEPGDDEVLADVQALPELLNNKDLWKLDWANFGVQYGGGTNLYWVAKPIAVPAVFYWRFTPKVAGNPVSGSNLPPFQLGSTVGPFGDGTYPIQTLKDLTDQYPSILTDLPAHE